MEFQHWSLRILEKHGVVACIALLLTFAMFRVTDQHLDFVKQQTEQMRLQTEQSELQTDILAAIKDTQQELVRSSEMQEKLLREVDKTIEDGIGSE